MDPPLHHQCETIQQDETNPVREIAIQEVEAGLYSVAQVRAYGAEIEILKKGEELPAKNHFCKFRPLLDRKGLLRVGGRLDNIPWAY